MSPEAAPGPRVDAIVALLVEELRALPHGTRAPGEAELIARFDIPRGRARQVISQLESNHLVTRRQGAGTYVNHSMEYRVDSTASLHQVVARVGGTVRTTLLVSDSVPVTAEIAARLGVPEGTRVPHLRRLGYIDGRPGVFLEEYLVPQVHELVGVALGLIESVEDVLRGYGHAPARTWCRGTADIPPPQARDVLSLPAGQQTWRVESVLTDRSSGAPLAASVNWSRMDVVHMVFEFNINPEAT
ncbi:GntR family transcriptional regulator [Granulicoccus phenolivorans]|uniref:GntR family transcriptional regulator n=1 Tax=Granulicoccus phenolivorans TaxID=266854 RepID=UPI0004176639|nr:GntR family transcriptional regulator [Granulicoccus phenolivorans]